MMMPSTLDHGGGGGSGSEMCNEGEGVSSLLFISTAVSSSLYLISIKIHFN